MGDALSPVYDTTTEDLPLLRDIERMCSAQSIAGLGCQCNEMTVKTRKVSSGADNQLEQIPRYARDFACGLTPPIHYVKRSPWGHRLTPAERLNL